MIEKIEDIAQKMVADGRGILAADESTATIKKRFDSIDTQSTEESRRDYREMLFSTQPTMEDCISGVILFDETIKQNAKNGTPFVQLMAESDTLAGIKVDTGAKSHAGFEGETVTEGLDGLSDRLNAYYELGARFAKWRGVINISEQLPTAGNIHANAHALARYAACCQAAHIVPIVEPEIMMDGVPGDHSIERCEEVTSEVLRCVFEELALARVRLEGIILKPNMVIDGINQRKASVDEVAEKTVAVLKKNVPAAVPGIAFLSGGQTDIEATAHLNAMNAGFDMPFALTFSYGRALQASALQAWGGKAENVKAGQQAFSHRARMNQLAALGNWSSSLEHA